MFNKAEPTPLLSLCVLLLVIHPSDPNRYPCNNPIYCYGELLHTVQMSNMYADSKTFVDMMMLRNASEILADFKKLLEENDNNIQKNHVHKFVNENFAPADELVEWVPEDFTPHPKFLDKINNIELRNFAEEVINRWPKLSRKMSPEVLRNPDRYSTVALPHGFVVPGGRFRECYYWDNYWIIKGLIASEMYQTVRGILCNFVFQIKTFGFIPNGNRIYYSRRSQPPLFTSMVWQYYKATEDVGWLGENLEFVEAELLFWLTNHSVQIGKHQMAHYMPDNEGPRPEAYKEDVMLATLLPVQERQRFYIDMIAAAESGWDFSSRWFYGENFPIGHITEIYTQRTIPVDLNSYLCKSFKDVSTMFSIVGNNEKSAFWNEKAQQMQLAIEEVHWNEEDGIWYDFDYIGKTHRKAFFASNLTPLWARVQHSESTFERAYQYLESQRIFDYSGGTPTSLTHTGEQWDFPNTWAPLLDTVIRGLLHADSAKLQNRALDLATNWINAVMIGYNKTGELFEKYNSEAMGLYGSGGEYTVQCGFGWTNGLVLDLIKTFYSNE